MWYPHYRHFEKVTRYPQMIKWLNETEDAIADIKLWGFECDVYQWAHLEGFLKRCRCKRIFHLGFSRSYLNLPIPVCSWGGKRRSNISEIQV
jgi:hypothetical protein